MSIIVLTVTHLGAFTLGASTFWVFVRRQGPTLAADTHLLEDNHVTKSPKARPSWRTSLAVGILVVSLFVIGFGIQQAKFQSDQAAFRECVSGWATTTTDTLETRVAATGRVDKFQKDRDTALDNVVLVVIALRADPPRATPKEFGAVLRTFAAARARLQDAESAATTTRSRNPYPALECAS